MKKLVLFLMSAYFSGQIQAQYIDRTFNYSIDASDPSYYIDVDLDGTNDFHFVYDGPGWDGVVIFSEHSGAEMLVFSGNNNLIKPLNLDQTIENTMPGEAWSSLTTPTPKQIQEQYTYAFTVPGNPTARYDAGFMPIKVNNMLGYVFFDGDYLNGTSAVPCDLMIISSRLKITSDSLNTPSSTGSGVSINDIDTKSTLFTLTNQNQVLLASEMTKPNYTYTVHNLFGQMVESGTLANGQTILENTSISEGMYVLTVFDENKVLGTSKFMKSTLR